ncbi:MAG: UDP-2,3-diacylglucosamine diphosphatase LpxI [Xanthobacteraceae bacterium]|nr:UDP-2,3-diacylglucosamine diphosphatase LpxI [Xanthobacteraceae bacterium]
MSQAPTPGNGEPVAIICGGGTLPLTVAAAVGRDGRPVVLFPIHGWADPSAFEGYRHHWLHLGSAGRFRRLAHQEGCRDVVMIGNVIRPAIRDLRFDWLTLRLLPRVFRIFKGGDDTLLSGIAKLFEEHGFRLVGAHEVAPEILVAEGPLGLVKPSAAHEDDIARGFELIAAINAFDVGQAVVVANNRVLAIEAAEGTDQMLDRIAALRAGGRINIPENSGVLVKAPKPTQDRRIDLPSIGPRTIEKATQAKLAGIAVAAGETIIAEPARVAEAADRAGLFVVGKRPGATP